MAHFGLKIPKGEQPDKTPYTVYYHHDKDPSMRNWNQGYIQVVSIDPARKNYAIRIERRYHNLRIVPLVFDKVSIQSNEDNLCKTFHVLSKFLDKYLAFFLDSHYIIIERQLPQNHQATLIAQHSKTYFSLKLENTPLLPAIIDVDPKLKGKMLGAPKNITDKQLKSWAVGKARQILKIRDDQNSLSVMDGIRKQDDLADTICQIEALFMCWGLPITPLPVDSILENTDIKPQVDLTKFLSSAPTQMIVIPS